jgi:Contractile injection system tape measure protein
MNHIIQQQHLRVVLHGTESDGMALQGRLAELCQHWLAPVIERVLDRYAPTDGHLYIDRLELDLGQLRLDQLEQNLAEQVQEMLEKSIQETVRESVAAFSNKKEKEKAQFKSHLQTLAEVLGYFLETGRLPWSYQLPVGKTLESVLLEEWQSKKTNDFLAFIPHFFTEILSQENARKRLLGQFSNHFSTIFLSSFYPQISIKIQAIKNQLNQAGISSEMLQLLEKPMREIAFEMAAEEIDFQENIFIKKILEKTQNQTDTSKKSLFEKLTKTISKLWPEIKNDLPENPEIDATEIQLFEKKNLKLNREKNLKNSIKKFEDGEGIYIENAGLVLLHPFLPRFFDGLGMTFENRMHQREKALCLLQHFCTGQSGFPEYELVLPKILCGLALDFPVETSIILSEAEKEETEAVLKATIRYWEALRNTTPDGLRGTFLCRPGKLSLKKDGDWLLQVEPKSYDILLDHLPWSISMIKLPWMTQMLWTEWGN